MIINTDLLFGLGFIFIMTTLGALCVFFLGSSKNTSVVNGFSAGVMMSATFWSLLLPAVEGSSDMGNFAFLPVCFGVVAGSAFIFIIEKIFSLKNIIDENAKCRRLLLAVTVHNIPEGMAVGFAYGANPVAPGIAFGVALGIGLQNFPEGFATALPVKSCTGSKLKAFAMGTLSGAVEPVFGLIGALLASKLIILQPFALAFSAGAMLCVCVSDLIPDCSEKLWGKAAFILGFCVMTALDVAFS